MPPTPIANDEMTKSGHISKTRYYFKVVSLRWKDLNEFGISALKGYFNGVNECEAIHSILVRVGTEILVP